MQENSASGLGTCLFGARRLEDVGDALDDEDSSDEDLDRLALASIGFLCCVDEI